MRPTDNSPRHDLAKGAVRDVDQGNTWLFSSARPKRVRCWDVARNRARRQAKRRRAGKLLWPFILVLILVELIVERRPIMHSFLSASFCAGRPGKGFGVPRRDGPAVGHLTPPAPPAEGEERFETAVSAHRPPQTFLARDVAQIVAYLIRNRGRVDNEVVRRKWERLDSADLSLAVFLRDVEARGDWRQLSAELRKAQVAAPRPPAGMRQPSLFERRLFGMIPEWSARGEVLLIQALTDDEGSPVEKPDEDHATETARPTW